MRVRLGGIGGTAYLSGTTSGTAQCGNVVYIANRNSASSQVGGVPGVASGLGGSATALATGAVDTTSDTTLVITGQLATGTDTISLESFVVELLPA